MPVPKPIITDDRIRRFCEKYDVDSLTGCWLWHGGVNEHGYGLFWNGERLEKAHRFILRVAGIDVPASADVCHECDTPPCVNPNHLYVGSAKTNVGDMIERMRHKHPRRYGNTNHAAKLTSEQVAEIRDRIGTGEVHRSIAADYGVSKSLISRIKLKEIWTNGDQIVIVKTGVDEHADS